MTDGLSLQLSFGIKTRTPRVAETKSICGRVQEIGCLVSTHGSAAVARLKTEAGKYSRT